MNPNSPELPPESSSLMPLTFLLETLFQPPWLLPVWGAFAHCIPIRMLGMVFWVPWTQFHCVCWWLAGGGVSPHQQQAMLWTQAGCPTIQLNVDTIYLEIVSDFTGWGLSPTRLLSLRYSPLQMPVTSPCRYLFFWPTGYRSEVPTTPFLGSINLLQRLTELRETFYLLGHQFMVYYKRL